MLLDGMTLGWEGRHPEASIVWALESFTLAHKHDAAANATRTPARE
jgi:hypothetical protein